MHTVSVLDPSEPRDFRGKKIAPKIQKTLDGTIHNNDAAKLCLLRATLIAPP